MTLRASLLALCLLGGCDRVFGLIGGDDTTNHVPDAAGGSDDGGADARAGCPEWFTEGAGLELNESIVDIAAGDLTGDGLADIALLTHNVLTTSHFVDIYASTGAGPFATFGQFPVTTTTTEIEAADLVPNGNNELAVLDPSANVITLYAVTDNSLASLDVVQNIGLNARSMTVGDLDGQAPVDIAWAASGSNSYGNYTHSMTETVGLGRTPVYVGMLGRSGASGSDPLITTTSPSSLLIRAAAPQAIALTGEPGPVAGGHLAGGTPIVAVAMLDATIEIYELTSTNFELRTSIALSSSTTALTFIDLDHDGSDELVTTQASTSGGPSSVEVFQWDASGTFMNPTPLPYNHVAVAQAFGDFDGDTFTDLVIAGTDDSVAVYRNCR
ncbi:MAG TPA: VCBS repeat-containing protein [Kofleriaceae bacterium]|jgi:hypothetical protein